MNVKELYEFIRDALDAGDVEPYALVYVDEAGAGDWSTLICASVDGDGDIVLGFDG